MFFVLIFHNFPVRQNKLKRVPKCKKFIRQHISYVSSSLNIGDHFSNRNDPTVEEIKNLMKPASKRYRSFMSDGKLREMVKNG